MTTNKMSFLYGSVLSAGLALLPFSTILAETATGQLGVSAQVVATCHVVGDGATLNFEAYSPAQDTDHAVSTEFSVQCTTPTTVSAGLGGGGSPSAGQRRMAGQGTFLRYDLYQVISHATRFGDGGADLGERKPVPISAANTPIAVPVYGKIPKAQAVPTGAYDDSVQISIGF